MDQFLEKLRNKINLNFNESKDAFKILMNGDASDQQIYDFLTLLSDKGEVSDEIAGGVYILRDKSKRVKVENCIDTCGTGGDGKDTLFHLLQYHRYQYNCQLLLFLTYLLIYIHLQLFHLKPHLCLIIKLKNHKFVDR